MIFWIRYEMVFCTSTSIIFSICSNWYLLSHFAFRCWNFLKKLKNKLRWTKTDAIPGHMTPNGVTIFQLVGNILLRGIEEWEVGCVVCYVYSRWSCKLWTFGKLGYILNNKRTEMKIIYIFHYTDSQWTYTMN